MHHQVCYREAWAHFTAEKQFLFLDLLERDLDIPILSRGFVRFICFATAKIVCIISPGNINLA